MFHSLKRFWLVLLLLGVGARCGFGFSLLGPLNEGYQVATIGYGLPGDNGGPKDLGDGYRWNTRNIYYACDSSFFDFFGTTGASAVDSGFAVFNALTNFSTYSSNLTEWPLTTSRYNETARNLSLLDLKSTTMSWVANMLGLAQPERYVWTIHDRYIITGTCPVNEQYVVVQRNFDPASQVYSSYVNGVLYDYTIVDICSGPNPIALATEFPVDPTTINQMSTAVAGGFPYYYGAYAPVPGRYYTGLTRDDVGGLRYLYATNRMNVEDVTTNSLMIFTNKNSQLLVTSNLALLAQQSLTNPPAALQALYPQLVINSFTNVFSNVVTTNITAYFTNKTFSPVGTLTLVLVTNFDTNVATLFLYDFANVVTNHHYTKGFVTTVQTNIGLSTNPFAPANTLVTNVTSKTVLATNFINGDYYIVPSNLFGFQILSTQLVKVIPITNTVVFATNVTGLPITNGQSFTMNIITYFTNFNFIVYPIELITNSVALRQGVDKINFIRQDFDSLLNNSWDPVTNYYTLVAVTNGVPSRQTYQRILTQPDILIQSSDHVVDGNPSTQAFVATFDSLNFDTSHPSSDGVGPGNIIPQIILVYGKGGGPILMNNGGFFQGEYNASVFPIWGTYDGTTNAPIVYPDSVSLADLQNAVLFQILSGLLPNGSVSVNNASNPYSTQLQAQGESTNIVTWALANGTNAPGLPNGLTLSTNGLISGVLTNAGVGTYDFPVQATDASGRVAQANLILEVDP